MAHYAFDDKHSFIKKVEELVDGGTPKRCIKTFTPYHVHETEHMLDSSPSNVRFFTGLGAISGFTAGWVLTIGTVMDWPLVTGGKPMASIPAFLVIAYELTILLGCLASFVGFLHFARVPVVQNLVSNREFSRQFEIQVEES